MRQQGEAASAVSFDLFDCLVDMGGVWLSVLSILVVLSGESAADVSAVTTDSLAMDNGLTSSQARGVRALCHTCCVYIYIYTYICI